MNNNILLSPPPQVDELPKGDASYLILLLGTMGGFLILSEILEEFPEIFSCNTMKKVVLWSFVYVQTKSIGIASFYSIIIVLLFPRIFFGDISGPRIKAKQEKEEIKRDKERLRLLCQKMGV